MCCIILMDHFNKHLPKLAKTCHLEFMEREKKIQTTNGEGVKKTIWAYPFDDILDERHLHRHEVHLGKEGGKPSANKIGGQQNTTWLRADAGKEWRKQNEHICLRRSPPLQCLLGRCEGDSVGRQPCRPCPCWSARWQYSD